MGIETILLVSAALKGGQAIAGGFQASAESEALDLKSKQENLRYQQESLKQLDLMEKVLDRQVVQAVAKGVSTSSPSFLAIRENTFNEGAKGQKNLETEESIFQQNIKIEKGNVKASLFSKMFGQAADIGFDFAKLNNATSKAKET